MERIAEPTTPYHAAMCGKPVYDPVAVLEAMRERGPAMYWSMCLDSTKPGMLAHFSTPDAGGTGSHCFPDFPSAVRWLHGQAAAADAEFGKQFPVPE